MSDDDMELVHGSGNVFRDFGLPDANLRQARALVGARILGLLDEQQLTNRDAERLTGVSHTEFSRIRNTQFRRFTLDRMIVILGKLLGDEVEVDVEVHTRSRPKSLAAALPPRTA